MRPDVQAEITRIWPQVTTETLEALTDMAGYREEFLKLFGFGLAGVDYNADIEPHIPMP
jgi:enoyl-[acyl-carrier protein] reductase/trans-2-enoyl-CoA reductase (NAD+)